MFLIICIVLGVLIGPHVFKMGIEIIGSNYKLQDEYKWVPHLLGGIFSTITLIVYAIMFVFKDSLTRFVVAYKETSK